MPPKRARLRAESRGSGGCGRPSRRCRGRRGSGSWSSSRASPSWRSAARRCGRTISGSSRRFRKPLLEHGCEAAPGARSGGHPAAARRRGATPDEVLTSRRSAAPRSSTRSCSSGDIESYDDVARYLPSVGDAEAASGRAARARALCRRRSTEALKGLPFKAGLFEPFLDDVEKARTLRAADAREPRRHSARAARRRLAASSRRSLDRPRHTGRCA